MEYNRNEMLTLLRENTCQVLFTKVNGEERNMTCTLMHKLIPVEQLPKGTALTEERKENENTIRVFDVNASGWRSFRIDNIKSFKVV